MSLVKELQELITTDKLSGFTATPEGHHGGEKVQRLETVVRERFGVAHAVTFNSATSALHAACVAASELVGDPYFVTTPFSFTASASCVLMAGHDVHFVDIEDKTYCINTNLIPDEANVIIPVHLFGHPCDMTALLKRTREKGDFIIEDAAQAITAKFQGRYCGTLGDCGIFSFNQSKQVSCGEGGVLVTNRDDVAEIVKLVRNHGETVYPDKCVLGYNYRMTEVEAVIAYHRFLDTDSAIAKRRRGMYIMESFFGIQRTCGIDDHAAFVYPIRVENNHCVAREMTEMGFFLRAGYLTTPLHRLPIFEGDDCPVADRMWSKELIVTDIIRQEPEVIDRFTKTLQGVLSAEAIPAIA